MQFKKFLLTEQNLDLESTMKDLGKPFPRKSDKNIKKNWKSILKCRMWTKTASEKEKLDSNKKKLDLEWTMNGFGQQFKDNPVQQI